MRGMKEDVVKIPISDILLDESIYPRETIDHRRIAIFELELKIFRLHHRRSSWKPFPGMNLQE